MRTALTFLSLTLAAAPLAAQAPRIAIVQPAGGKAGTTATISITGNDLSTVDGLHFSFPGAKVEMLGTDKALEDTMKKGGGGGGMAGMATRAALKFQVAIPPNTPAGIHDVRVVGKNGVSNPRAFVVGNLPEETEKESNDDVPLANKIPLNVTVSGVIDKGVDVDYFQFTGKKGDRVVASCLTSSIESKLQAMLDIYSLSGKRLASNRNYQNNDALTDAILPEDGEYLIRVAGFTYILGGPDFNYRLTVGTMPWIDSVVPAAVEPGKETKVEVLGRNLPGGVLDPKQILDGRPLERAIITVKSPTDPKATQRLATANLVFPAASALDGFDLRLANPSGSSNPYFLALAQSRVLAESEPNDDASKAPLLATPVQISGRIDRKGDVDWFPVAIKKDTPIIVELFSDRLNPSPLGAAVDLKFVVVGPKGNVISTQDENLEVMPPSFFARSEDPARIRLSPTEDGEYKFGVSSSDGSFGPRHTYSLRIAPEDGDFRAVAMPISPLSPDSAVSGPSGHYALNVFVWRLGNFTGDVTVSATKLPPGVTVKPQVISATQKQAAIVVSVADNAPPFTGGIELEATGVVNVVKQTREVRAATITYPTTQAGPPLLARLDRELVLAVRERAKYSIIPSTDKLTIVQGEKIDLKVILKPLHPDFKGTVQLSGVALPLGMVLAATTLNSDKESTLPFDMKSTVLPGNYTLVLRGQTQPVTNKPPAKGAAANIVEHAPPISLIIVPKQLVKLTPPDSIKVSRGKDAVATVQLSKLYPFEGPLELEAITAKGVTVSGMKWKGNEADLKVNLKAADDAPIGPASVTVRILARFNDTVIPHDLKLPVNITK